MNKWQTLKEHVNSITIGNLVTRPCVERLLTPRLTYSGVPTRYLRHLTSLGILQRMNFNDYKVMYHIKHDLTFKEFISASKGTWQRWFINVKA